MKKMVLISIVVLHLAGCMAEVGSEAWCSSLAKKPKGDWSLNEAKDYAQHCLLK
ncbi:MAG: DUF3012 domain-containing protein [Gammaproteobacteria bacterium]|nr:DUF3012 domain-containing protein [Gammaproteobacteria bacterium]MCP4993710.1 DUF3012 domain-containing protein [Gammaproteobacteria bacterium]